MCEETGQVHYSTVQSNVDDPSDQTNQLNDDQNVATTRTVIEKKIISAATQEEAAIIM